MSNLFESKIEIEILTEEVNSSYSDTLILTVDFKWEIILVDSKIDDHLDGISFISFHGIVSLIIFMDNFLARVGVIVYFMN